MYPNKSFRISKKLFYHNYKRPRFYYGYLCRAKKINGKWVPDKQSKIFLNDNVMDFLSGSVTEGIYQDQQFVWNLSLLSSRKFIFQLKMSKRSNRKIVNTIFIKKLLLWDLVDHPFACGSYYDCCICYYNKVYEKSNIQDLLESYRKANNFI